MNIEWGSMIEVNAKRPQWIGDDQNLIVIWDHFEGIVSQPNAWTPALLDKTGCGISWDNVYAIRLPADHFAYIAFAKGFTPWGGGDTPSDWDKGPVLLADGSEWDSFTIWWNLEVGNERRVIGYRKIADVDQPSPTDTVTIARMTEAEWRGHLGARNWERTVEGLNKLGLIREPTRAERLATQTGLPVGDVKKVLAAIDGEGE